MRTIALTTAVALALLVCPCRYALSQERPIVLAHRGGMGEFEENTLAAFRASYDAGIRGFEMDVRMTQDGELVVLHDDKLDRTHQGTGPIEHAAAQKIANIPTKQEGENLLFLSDFLDFFSDKPGVYIELEMKTSNKELYPDERIAPYCQKLYQFAEAKKAKGSIYVYSSFDERTIREIHRIDPKAPLSLIASKPCSKEFVERAKELGADRIACQLEGTSRASIKAAHQAGLKVNGWPGKSPLDYHLAIGLGLDVHCTDFPLAVRKAFPESDNR